MKPRLGGIRTYYDVMVIAGILHVQEVELVYAVYTVGSKGTSSIGSGKSLK